MKNIFLGFALVLLAVPAALAQIYTDKAEVLKASMDETAQQTQNYYANVAIPGAEEDVKAQDVRYEEALTPMNQANERHFDETGNLMTILDSEKKQ